MDDGKREVAIALSLSAEQFGAIDEKLGGIDGAINRLAENVSPVETSVAAEVSQLRTEVKTGLAEISDSINTASDNLGKWLAALALAVANPADNSAEIQKKLDELTAQLNQGSDTLQSAVDNAPK